MSKNFCAIAVAAALALLWTGPVLAKLTPAQKCVQAKLKAAGKLQVCKAKVRAKAEVEDTTADYTTCQEKLQEALTKADDKASGSGTACRFIDNHDGSVTDLNSGLVWEQKTGAITSPVDCSAGPCADPHDVNNEYKWSATGTAPDGRAFTDFLAKLNSSTSGASSSADNCFAKHCDWRLPTVEELQEIQLPSCTTSPCIDPSFGPTEGHDYGSATTEGTDDHSSLNVPFDSSGVPTASSKATTVYVRAVRGGF